MTTKNPHAVALGTKGGRARTPAKVAASRANWAKHRGRPVEYRIEEITGPYDVAGVALVRRDVGRTRWGWTPRALMVLAAWMRTHRPNQVVAWMDENGYVYFGREE